MIIWELEESEYGRLYEQLFRYAHAEPLEAFYTVGLSLNGKEYSVRIQPE